MTTKLNSPIWPRPTPSCARRAGTENTAASPVIVTIFNTTSRRTRPSTPASLTTVAGSTSVPIATKNMTAKRSRNGSTSRRASCASGRMDRRSPATNAASATGTPNTTAPMPAFARATETATMRKVSGCSRTRASSQGMTTSCATAAKPTNANALPNANAGASPLGARSTARIVAATSVTAS